MTEAKIADALNLAMYDPVPTPERPIGCCRVYVIISDADAAKVIAKIAKTGRFTFQKKGHYGLSNALYVGYDNCDGRVLARGTAVVSALKSVGVICYREEQGD